MLQLNPPLWLQTSKGCGLAHLVTWDSIEHSLYWTVFLDNGQIWTLPNEMCRAAQNITGERPDPEKP
jgi:hypothetical protein